MKVLQIFLFTIRRIVSIIELGRAITRPLWQENYAKVINIESIIYKKTLEWATGRNVLFGQQSLKVI